MAWVYAYLVSIYIRFSSKRVWDVFFKKNRKDFTKTKPKEEIMYWAYVQTFLDFASWHACMILEGYRLYKVSDIDFVCLAKMVNFEIDGLDIEISSIEARKEVTKSISNRKRKLKIMGLIRRAYKQRYGYG